MKLPWLTRKMLQKGEELSHSNIVPNHVNSIWLTGRDTLEVPRKNISQEHLHNILKGLSLNPTSTWSIITDDINGLKKTFQNLIDQNFDLNRLRIEHWRDLWKEDWGKFSRKDKSVLEVQIQAEVLGRTPLRNPASAADMLRYATLKVRPGYVFDVDTKFTAPLPEKLSAPHGIRLGLMRDKISYDDGSDESTEYLENGMLAAPPNSSFIDTILKEYSHWHSGKTNWIRNGDHHDRMESFTLNTKADDDAEPGQQNLTLPQKASKSSKESWSMRTLKRQNFNLLANDRRILTNSFGTQIAWETLINHLKIKQVIVDDDENIHADTFPKDVQMPENFYKTPVSSKNWPAPALPIPLSRRISAPELMEREVAWKEPTQTRKIVEKTKRIFSR